MWPLKQNTTTEIHIAMCITAVIKQASVRQWSLSEETSGGQTIIVSRWRCRRLHAVLVNTQRKQQVRMTTVLVRRYSNQTTHLHVCSQNDTETDNSGNVRNLLNELLKKYNETSKSWKWPFYVLRSKCLCY